MKDLLGRPAIDLDTPELQRFLAGKRVLVTGAGGSIGSEICRQAMRFCPERVVLLERAENNLFEIDRELRERWVGASLHPVLADICDARRVAEIFTAEKPQVVFHCAAHKHVPMMELNPGEAIRNNIFGTRTVANAAADAAVSAFVMVSTDKAVNPTSVMGATKRVAEMYVQSLNIGSLATPWGGEKLVGAREQRRMKQETHGPSTRFVAVRFGNVLGSSGSVVPIFQRQIDAGGPVTVTHPQMQRYFMTIPEASQLVMQAGAIGRGGEIFVLDMGQPIKILDLARELIRRNGLNPDKDILIEFSGVRPGEKLFEELALADEQIRPTSHDKIHVWQLKAADPHALAGDLDRLETASNGSAREAIAALGACVREYQPAQVAQLPRLRLVSTEPGVEAA